MSIAPFLYSISHTLETLIWAVFVITAISSITLVWSEYEEFGKPVLKTSIKKLKNRLKFF